MKQNLRRTIKKTLAAMPAAVLMMVSAMSPTVVSGADGSDISLPETDVARWVAAVRNTGGASGIAVVVGSGGADGGAVVELARQTKWIIFFQSDKTDEVRAVRKAASSAGLLCRRVFVDRGPLETLSLGDNLAGVGIAANGDLSAAAKQELARVLHPGGVRLLGDKTWRKPPAEGIDAWSHPYHGPDNNPQSVDRRAMAPYATQFITGPHTCPMPVVTVAAGGRLFRAYGHIAHRAAGKHLSNRLVAMNAANGLTLWDMPLRAGFMVHRAGFIATENELFVADTDACHVYDAATGKQKRKIVVPKAISDGAVWKWMALENGTLYALLGGEEVEAKPQSFGWAGIGGWGWAVWNGFDYTDPKTNFAHGRTLAAIRPATGKILWSRQSQTPLDGRGMCLAAGRWYYYSPQHYLACAEITEGRELWKTTDPALLKAIGKDGRAHTPPTGFASSAYLKCDKQRLYFAGPQRPNLVVVSATDGKVLWQNPNGNRHLILAGEAFYSIGQGKLGSGKLRAKDGKVLQVLPGRVNCTRATGSMDALFYRGGGTCRWDLKRGAATSIRTMRPPCTDGVLIADGRLHWGQWNCGCSMTFLGHICLTGTKVDPNTMGQGDVSRRLYRPTTTTPDSRLSLAAKDHDWPAWGGGNDRQGLAKGILPRSFQRGWTFTPDDSYRPTGPTTAGGLVFSADASGAVRAIDAATGSVKWASNEPGGAIFFPPAFAAGRVHLGAMDGNVYTFQADTGRLLWSFRVAPGQRWLPVYHRLTSNWPVAGGIVVENGVVFAAAGLADYDGMYVAALHAETGQVQWLNSTTGRPGKDPAPGVSLTGPLAIRDGELQFAGGTTFPLARFDPASGRFLNAPEDRVPAPKAIAFYPYFPTLYDQFMPVRLTLPDGNVLDHTIGHRDDSTAPLALLEPTPKNTKLPENWRVMPGRRLPPVKLRPKTIWELPKSYRLNGFITDRKTVIGAGQDKAAKKGGNFLIVVDAKSGKELWRDTLPAAPVKAAIALDHTGRLFVALVDGRIVEYHPPKEHKNE